MDFARLKASFQIKKSDGFSLIELMIAVGIISILAATAIAGYEKYKLDTMRSEIGIVFNRMFTDQVSFYQKPRVYGNTERPACFLYAPFQPFNGSLPTEFTAGVLDFNWTVVGIPTSGKVHFSYAVNGGPGGGTTPWCFHYLQDTPALATVVNIAAYQDMDKDGSPNFNMFPILVDEDGLISKQPIYTVSPNVYE